MFLKYGYIFSSTIHPGLVVLRCYQTSGIVPF